jgi:hypothetical protein
MSGTCGTRIVTKLSLVEKNGDSVTALEQEVWLKSYVSKTEWP